LRFLRWVIIDRGEYERLKATERALEVYQALMEAAAEMVRSAIELMSHL